MAPRYRWRTSLRTWLPSRPPLYLLVRKGRDCRDHEWYRSEGDVWRCYHCRAQRQLDGAHAEFQISPAWALTGNPYLPVAARVDDEWWVLRLNNFPDHPLWTLFIDGVRRFDLEEVPPPWGKPLGPGEPELSQDESGEALANVADLVAYGSEVGQPCDNPFCCG